MYLRKSFIVIVLVALSIIFLFPFYWVLISSLKSTKALDEQPPSFYPAQQRRISASIVTTGRTYVNGNTDYLWLLDSPDLATKSRGKGAYYLELEQNKQTEHVQWFKSSQVKPVSFIHKKLTFPEVDIYRTGNSLFGLLAKSVSQTPNGFDEIDFAVPASRQPIKKIAALFDVKSYEVREFHAVWSNYSTAWKGPESTIGTKSSGFLLFMRNSLFISCMAVLGQVFVSSLVAFGFARLRFKGRDGLFILLLATLMIPSQVTLIPLFAIYKSIGWVDTFLPLIVPGFFGGAFNIFLIRQFMQGFPKELDESAMIDGASAWKIFSKIILPNCTPVLIIVGLFTFVASWQDVLGPLIYLDNPNYRTVSLGLEYFRSPYVDNRAVLLAGAVISILPVACFFLIAQRYILSGIVTTGLK